MTVPQCFSFRGFFRLIVPCLISWGDNWRIFSIYQRIHNTNNFSLISNISTEVPWSNNSVFILLLTSFISNILFVFFCVSSFLIESYLFWIDSHGDRAVISNICDNKINCTPFILLIPLGNSFFRIAPHFTFWCCTVIQFCRDVKCVSVTLGLFPSSCSVIVRYGTTTNQFTEYKSIAHAVARSLVITNLLLSSSIDQKEWQLKFRWKRRICALRLRHV